MSGIRSWVAASFFFRSGKAVSCFRSWFWWKAILEPEDIACGQTFMGVRILCPNPVDQAQFLQLGKVVVQRRDRHFRIVGQPRLCREAAEVRVVPVAQESQHDLGGRLQPALLDGPDGRLVAHSAILRAELAMRVANP